MNKRITKNDVNCNPVFYHISPEKRKLYADGEIYPTRKFLIDNGYNPSQSESRVGKKFFLDFVNTPQLNQTFFDCYDSTMENIFQLDMGSTLKNLTPLDVFLALQQLVEEGQLDLNNPEVEEVYLNAKYIASYENFLQSLNLLEFNTLGNMPELTKQDIRTFFDSELDYASFAKQQNNSFEFRQKLYQLDMLCNELTNMGNYQIPQEIKQRIRQLSTFEFGDFENIPALLRPQQKMDIYQMPIVSPELHNCIFDNMPKDLTKLQQALYIYFKLCNVLTYDDSYFNEGYITSKSYNHRDITKVKEVTPQNNNVICSEFTAILAVLLREIDVKAYVNTINSKTDGRMEHTGTQFPFDGTHVLLRMNIDQFSIEADSTPSILTGDLAYSRFGEFKHILHEGIEDGLYCDNTNGATKLEFDRQTDIVLNILANENNNEVLALRKQNLKDLSLNDIQKLDFHHARDIYSRLPQNHYPISFGTRVDLLCKIVQSCDLHGLQLAQYLTIVSNKLFTSAETDHEQPKLKLSFVRNDTNLHNPNTTIILSYKNKKAQNPALPYNYCILDGGKSPQFMTRDQIFQKFANADFVSLKQGTQPLDIPEIKQK